MADVDKLLNAIESAEAESYGVENDGTLSADRAAALDAYFGKNTTPAPEGNSQVISRDLFDTVEWIVPSLTRIFAGSDEVVKFEPIGPNDEAQSKQESLYVNHIITQKNRWEQIFHDWSKDALLTKNAYCLAYWEDGKHVEYEKYQRQSDDAFALLMQEEGIEVLEHSEQPDEDAANSPEFQQAQAMGMPVRVPMVHSVKIRRTQEHGKPCLKVLPPERCLVHQRTPDYMLEDCDFFEYWEEVTISSLRQRGFDVPDDIDADERGANGDSQEDTARDLYGEERSRLTGWEPSMRKVRARMCWIRHDYDDDGIAELQYCLVVGRNILYREECNRIPVASIVATPVPHRHVGISIADVVLDIQETKTAILRQGIDNLFHANNPRLFLTEKINLDDALVSRPGGVIRGEVGTVFGQDIAPIVIPNVFPQAVQGLEYMDQVREGRTGTNRYFTGTDENSLNKTASGIAQLSSSAAQRVEQIARMMAPSVEYLFGVVHELILKHGHKSEVVRIKGEWVSVDPANWRKRRDLKIAVGLGSGNKEALLAHLMNIYQAQVATLQLGMDITEPALIYNTLAEMTKTAGFPSEAQFWKRPGPPQPQPPSPEEMKMQIEAQKAQMEAQAREQEMAMDERKAQIEAQLAEQEMAHKERMAQLEEQKMLLELEIKRMQVGFQGEELQIKREGLQLKGAEQAMGLQASQAQHGMDMEKGQLEIEKAKTQAKAQKKEEKAPEKQEKDVEQIVAKALKEQLGEFTKYIDGGKTVGIERIRDQKTGKLIGARRKLADGRTEDVPIQ